MERSGFTSLFNAKAILGVIFVHQQRPNAFIRVQRDETEEV